MTVKEWVNSNAVLKDGVSLDELEKLVNDLDPLKNITTKEQAIDFMNRNSVFKSGIDSVISTAVASHDERFQKEKLPGILKEETEKIRLELNPKETPEQKRLRELEEKLAQADKRETVNKLKMELREKAKELKYNGDTDRYAVYGEDAFKYLQEDKEYMDTRIEEVKKEFYKDNPAPHKGEPNPNIKTIKRNEFDQLPHDQRMEFIKSGGFTV